VSFVALYYTFSREAELQRREIDEARVEVATVRADLLVEEARRQALDQDHAQLMRQYEEGRLSRSELASQLATAQGQIEILGDRIASLIAERDQIAADLAVFRTRLSQSESTIAAVNTQLRGERERREALEQELGQTNVEHQRSEAELNEDLAAAEARADMLASELAHARAEADDARERTAEMEGRLESAESARDAAQRDLADLESRMADLRAMLERPRERAPREPDPTDEPSSMTDTPSP
jgi:chromosome segregation ATPase